MAGEQSAIGAAQATEQIVNQTPSFRVQEQQAQMSAKEAVLKTMRGMKEARERIGDFCVVVGEGEKEAVILRSPVTRTVDRQGSGGSTWQETYHTYVLFSGKTGIKAVNFVQDATVRFSNEQARQSLLEENKKNEGAFLQALEGVARSGDTGGSQSGYWEYLPAGATEVDDRQLDFKGKHIVWGRRGDTKVTDLNDAAVVEQAVKASISAVRAKHQEGIDAATATIDAAESVNRELGIGEQPAQVGSEPQASEAQLPPPPPPQKSGFLGGMFRRGR